LPRPDGQQLWPLEGGHDVYSLFDPLVFFPTLTQEMLDENQSWLKPTYIDHVSIRHRVN
jgi:hypothetical protein